MPSRKATYAYTAFPRTNAAKSSQKPSHLPPHGDPETNRSRRPTAARQLILAEHRLRNSTQDKSASRKGDSKDLLPRVVAASKKDHMDRIISMIPPTKYEAPPSAWTAPALKDLQSDHDRQIKPTGRRARGDSVDARSASATSSHSHQSSTPLLGNVFAVPPRKSSRRHSRVRREDVCDPIEVPTLHPQRRTESTPIRRKPVPSQLRPRPSSPTLHHRDFMALSPPRVAPSVPRGVTPVNPEFVGTKRRSVAVTHPKSFWDLDSDDESGSEDEKVGLVGRVRNGLNLKRTSKDGPEVDAVAERAGRTTVTREKEMTRKHSHRGSRPRRADRVSWSERFFCGC